MKKCKSCGSRFDPDEPANFEGVSEKMESYIEEQMERGTSCASCIFDTAFEMETSGDFDDEEDECEDE